MLDDLFSLSIKSFAFVLFLFLSSVACADEKPAIALIIDDVCGDNGARSKAILELRNHINITFSVLPNGSQPCLDSLVDIDWKSSDKMLHMPMEPTGDANPGKGAIMVDDTRGKVLSKLSNAYKLLPDVIGVNNHMGSAVTADAKLMQSIVTWVARKRMFYIDSATSQINACDAVTGQKRCYRNDIFLDHVQTKADVTKALKRAVKRAKSLNRPIIAIAHPHPETLKALEEFIAKDQVEFISIGSYLDRRASSEQSE